MSPGASADRPGSLVKQNKTKPKNKQVKNTTAPFFFQEKKRKES